MKRGRFRLQGSRTPAPGALVPTRLRQQSGVLSAFPAARQRQPWVELSRSPSRPATPATCAVPPSPTPRVNVHKWRIAAVRPEGGFRRSARASGRAATTEPGRNAKFQTEPPVARGVLAAVGDHCRRGRRPPLPRRPRFPRAVGGTRPIFQSARRSPKIAPSPTS